MKAKVPEKASLVWRRSQESVTIAVKPVIRRTSARIKMVTKIRIKVKMEVASERVFRANVDSVESKDIKLPSVGMMTRILAKGLVGSIRKLEWQRRVEVKVRVVNFCSWHLKWTQRPSCWRTRMFLSGTRVRRVIQPRRI